MFGSTISSPERSNDQPDPKTKQKNNRNFPAQLYVTWLYSNGSIARLKQLHPTDKAAFVVMPLPSRPHTVQGRRWPYGRTAPCLQPLNLNLKALSPTSINIFVPSKSGWGGIGRRNTTKTKCFRGSGKFRRKGKKTSEKLSCSR